MYFLLTIISTALIFLNGALSKGGKSPELTIEEQLFDFGHVGIEYDVQHQYIFENRTSDTIRILKATPLCDCTSAYALDSIVFPGNTTFININFSTKDQYGPTNKEIVVTTDHKQLDSLHYYYLAIVGQWFDGIRSDPSALLFLPKKGPQSVKIPNYNFDKISISSFIQYRDFFTIKETVSEAKKGESLTFVITPRQDLPNGNYRSNVTLHINKGEESEETILTIPVKIVVY